MLELENKMQLYLVRHGTTKGNREGRYVGSTDEELTNEAVAKLHRQRDMTLLSQIERVVVSPLKRCRQTADILFPGISQFVVEDFRECDFGKFEYCNYEELNGNPAYQQFIDTFGKSGFPEGEDRETFQKRCVAGFEKMMTELEALSVNGDKTIALVVHGGTIMALLDRYSDPHRDYYDWQTGNGKGFVTEVIRDTGNGNWKFVDTRDWK